jgi:hypothetical protein
MRDTMESQQQSIASWMSNIIGGSVVTATLFGAAPAFAAFIAIVWYCIQIYESATVQRWLATRRTRRLARLKARVLMLEAQSKTSLPGPGGGL